MKSNGFDRLARFARPTAAWLAAVLLVLAVSTAVSTQGRKFYDDDPIVREPEPQDASGVAPWDVGLLYDLSYNLFLQPGRDEPRTRARNVNTVDEVPDSSWFTNRIGSRAVALDDILRGPSTGPAPEPSRWTVIRPKSAGAAPGFTARDGRGETWFISFDPPSAPEGASAAIVVATKIFWALGYNQVENYVTRVDPAVTEIASSAQMRRPSGTRSPMTGADLGAVFERSARSADGSYRAAAGRLLSGKILGSFRYRGTRPDDPNDLVPHEHRRELRALRVFGAWLNLTDLKAGNTLDTLVTENGRGVVKHYLQDVGSTFGVGANGAKDWSEGWEHLYQGDASLRRFVSFGFWFSPWQVASYEDHAAVGPFEAARFDPRTWRPRVPTAAFFHLRPDDAFWAARRVMAFDDDTIRKVAEAGEYSDPRAAKYLADVLIARRNRIGQIYLTAINPIVDPVLEAGGTLRFVNEAVRHGFAARPERYEAVWHAFDNATRRSQRIAETTGSEERLQAPEGLPSAIGNFVRIDLSARSTEQAAWAVPIQAYFRRTADGWKLVGLDRLPEE